MPPRTSLIGHVADTDLLALYSAAPALVYPSVYEGLGLPVLEALASGCPVLAANATSLPEVGGAAYDGNGSGALFYFDPANAEELAAKIHALLAIDSQACAQIIRRGREHAQLFSWKKCAAETRLVLEAAESIN